MMVTQSNLRTGKGKEVYLLLGLCMVLTLDGNLEHAAHVESKRGLSTFSLGLCMVLILDGNSENDAHT